MTLDGTLGPRCKECSGLGATLRISGTHTTKSASKCNACDGTGVDLQVVRESVISDLQERVSALEDLLGRLCIAALDEFNPGMAITHTLRAETKGSALPCGAAILKETA